MRTRAVARSAPAGPFRGSASGRLRSSPPSVPGTRAGHRPPSGGPRRRGPSVARSASSSRNRRQAVNCSLALGPGPRTRCPMSGSRRSRNHARSSPSGRTSSSFRSRPSASSDSRIPAWALTISPRAQNEIPVPYGRQRPCRQVMASAACRRGPAAPRRGGSCRGPGSPTIVDELGCRSRRAARTGPSACASSVARPTNGPRVAARDVDPEPCPRRDGVEDRGPAPPCP